MARVIREEIKDAIISNNQLAADFCDHMGIKFISLDQMLRRNNRTLTHADNIAWLCEKLNKSQDELLIENEVNQVEA